jgi:hypothetical protein
MKSRISACRERHPRRRRIKIKRRKYRGRENG